MPSSRHSTASKRAASSRANTLCISDVPGLAKHTSTPPSDNVWTIACAPFIARFYPVAGLTIDRWGTAG